MALGKVRFIRGDARILRGDGREDALRVGDVVNPGDVVRLLSAGGLVIVEDEAGLFRVPRLGEPLTPASMDLLPNTSSEPRLIDRLGLSTGEIERVVQGLNGVGNGDGDPSVAPSAGEAGSTGDWKGVGRLVERIGESVTPLQFAFSTSRSGPTAEFLGLSVDPAEAPSAPFSSDTANTQQPAESAPAPADTPLNISNFTDNFVNGVTYTTSSGVVGLTGDSGAAGSFSYRAGDVITFKIGDVVVGIFSADVIQGDLLFLQDIAGTGLGNTNANYVENMAIFLQALDDGLQDATPGDGVLETANVQNSAASYVNNITITQATRDAFTGYVDSVTGLALNLASSGKEDISRALASIGIQFSRETELDVSGAGNNIFEAVAMQHVVDTIQSLAGPRTPLAVDQRLPDEIDVPGTRINYNYNNVSLASAEVTFTTNDLLTGAVPKQVSFYDLVVKDVRLAAEFAHIGNLESLGNGNYVIRLNPGIDMYDLEDLAVDYRVEDWTAFRDVRSSFVDNYRSHLSAVIPDVREDAGFNQFTLKSSLIFGTDSALSIDFTSELLSAQLGYPVAEYADDYSVPIQYSNDGGQTWLNMIQSGVIYNQLGVPRATFGFVLSAGSDSVEIRVPIFDDVKIEDPVEYFDAVVFGDMVYNEHLKFGILDNDVPPSPQPQLSINFVYAVEGDGDAIFTVSLSAPSALPVSVDFSITSLGATAGEDYVPVSGTLNFLPGQTAATIAVPVIDDLIIESALNPELAVVVLTNPVNAVIADAQGTLRIFDNDGPYDVSVSINLDPVTPDNTIRAAELNQLITLTGTVVSGGLPTGIVVVNVNGVEYRTRMLVDGTFSVDVPASQLVDDVDQIVSASVFAYGPGGSKGTASTSNAYDVQIDQPVAANDTINATEDTPFSGSLAGNDTPSGDGGNVWALATGAANGTVTVNADGTFTYTPNANFNGVDSFTYTLTDVDNDVSTATATITVNAVDDTPTAVADSFSVNEDAVLTGSLAGNDTVGGDGGAGVWSLLSGPANGAVTVASNGSFTFTPTANFNGVTSFTYTLADSDGTLSTATATITVNAVDDTPTAVADSFSVNEDAVLTGSLAGNDTVGGDGGAGVWSLLSGPANGAVTVASNGSFTFTPTANFNGVTSFTYTLADSDGTLSTATATITVNAVDDTPTAVADSFSVNEDAVLTGSLAGNDTVGGDGGAGVWSLLSGPANGAVTVASNGSFTFTPTANFNGVTSFTYTLADSDGTLSTATATITVNAVDDTPTAVADSFSVNEDAVLTGSLAGNDTVGGDGGAGVWSLLSGPANGAVTVASNGSFTFTPTANFNGVTSFTYTLADSDGTLSTATATITVNAVDDTPTAVADSFSVNEDAVLTGSLAGNDTVGGDGGAGVWSLLSGPANGAVTVASNGSFTFTPTANFNGVTSFTYTLADSDGTLSTATATITVNAVDDTPTAVADSFSVNEDAVLTGSLAGNDTVGGDGGAGVWSLLSGPANGAVTVASNGSFTFTPTANFNGVTSFTYTLADSDGTLSTATATITVNAVDDTPTAVADSFSVNEDAVLTGSLAGNDTVGGDGGAGVWSLLSGPANGAVTVASNGSFTFTPTANFNGVTSFTYTLADSDGTLSTATATITVNAVDDTPTAVADSFSVNEDAVLTGSLAGNDTVGGDGGAGVWSLLSGPANGAVTVASNGSFTFTPTANFNGVTSFTYTLADSDGTLSTATATITVNAVDDTPTAVADSFSVNEDAVLTGSLAGNDTVGGDGGAGVWSLLSGPANGAVTVASNGSFTFTPTANFNGVTSFTYTLADSDGTLSTATATITVNAVDDTPTAVADSFSVNEDAVLTGSLAGNDTVGGDGGAGVWSLLSGPANGAVTVASNGSFTFTPTANFNGVTSFTYTLADSDGTLSTATATITVNAVDDTPTAVADSFSVNEDAVLTGSLAGNDTVGGDGGAGVWSLLSGPANGAVTVASNGSFTFTPTANFNGVTSFTYTLADSDGTLSTATATITVNAVDDTPTAVADSFSVNEDAVLTGSLAGNDTVGGDGGAGVWSLLSGPANGAVTVASNGSFTFTPTANFNGVTSFTYTLADSDGTLSTATATITVNAVDDTPTAVADSFSVNEDAVLTGSLAGNDTVGGDGGAGVWSLLSGPANGAVTVASNGSFTFTPTANFNGVTSFTYTLADSDGTLSTATATITVNAVDDTPTAVADSFSVNEDAVLTGSLAGNDTVGGDGGAGVWSLLSGPANGAVTVASNGSFTFTPTANFNGVTSFTYTLADSDGTLSTATATITVNAVDDTPTAVADSFSVNEDAVLTGSLAGNDTVGGDGGAGVWSLLSGPANGAVTVASNGSFTFTPTANFNGVTSFTYTLADSDGTLSTATATITVNAVDDTPTAVADSFSVNEDAVLTGSLAGNDTVGGDGGAGVWSLLSGPANGAVTVASNGSFTFTPTANFNGVTSFTYTLADSDGTLSTATATITVNAVDDTPTAVADSFSVNEDAVLTGSLAGNDTVGGDGGAGVWSLLSGPANGAVTVASNGSFTFTPTANFNGVTSFTYTLADSDGTLSTATATITVNAVDDTPTAVADSFSVNEDAVLTGSLAGNDTVGGDGGAGVWSLLSGPANGAVTVASNGSFTFTPTANFNGVTSFTYTLADSDGTLSTATATITVNAVDDTPTAVADSFSVNEDAVLTGSLAGNDTVGGDGGAGVWSLLSGPANGAVTVASNGSFTFTPTANFNGVTSFTYTLADSDGTLSTATATITVNAVDDTPTAVADSFSVNEDAVLTGSLAGNDTVGGDGGAGVWSLLSGPANGAVTVASNGSFTFTPTANFNGVTSFTYTLADSDGTLSTATATITVNAVDDTPTAVADSFSVNEDAVLTGSLAGNDTVGGDGGAGVWSLLSGPANGAVTVASNGSFTFTPTANFNGVTSFTYTLADSDGTLSTATATITVNAVDDTPTAVADSFSVNEDAVLTGSLAGNDTVGGDGGAGVWSLLSGPANGAVTVASNGSFTFTPTANFNGVTSFTYTLADSDGTLSTATATITVNAVDDTPTAVADSFSVNEDAVLTGSLAGNDTVGGDGGAGVWSLLSGPANGAVTVASNGSFTFTPTANFNGVTSFTYTLADSDGTLSTATATITVNAVDDTPTAVADSFSVNEDAVLTGSLAGNDTVGGDGGAGVWSLLSGPANGAVTVASNGSFTFTPTANFNGVTSFTYTLADSDGTLSTATATITVNAVDDTPTAVADSFSVNEDAVLTGSLAGNDTVGGDGGAGVWSLLSGPANGAVTVASNGSFTFTPTANFNGVTSFTYTLADSDGTLSTATATITVNAVDDTPTAVADSFSVNEDAVLTGSLAGNDTVGGDGGAGVWSLLSGPANGAVTVASNGSFTFTPTANFNGVTSFTYTLADSDGTLSTATATITVNAVDDTPTAVAVTTAGVEDSVIPFTLSGTDVDGTITSFALTSLPATGRIYRDAALTQLIGIGEVIPASGATMYYVPFSEFAGSVTFGYTVTDNNGAVSASSANVTINVTAVNDGAPVASNDSITLPTGATYFISKASLLGNDTLFDNAVITGNTAVSGGTLTPVYDGLGILTGYNYTPAGAGAFTFTYTLTDNDQPAGQTSTATVTLNVVNATDDFATVNESSLPGGSGGGSNVASGTLFNGTEAASDITQIVFNSTIYTATGGVITIATGTGTLVVQATGVSRGNYTYTLTSDAVNGAPGSATDTGVTQNFTYSKADATSATLRVTITDDRPIATNMTVEIPESPTPAYNLLITLDVSGSMLVQGSGGGVKRTNPDGSVEVTTRMQMAQDALGSLVSEYFRQSPDVTVKLVIFADSAQTVGTYSSAATAIAAINGLTNPANSGAAVTTSTMAAAYTGVGSGTNYEAALDTTRIQMGSGAAGKQNLVYFLSDGVPTVGDVTIGAIAGDPYFDYVQWLAANNIKSFGVGIGGGIADTSYLNIAHNVDAAGDGAEDPAIIVPDINDLGEQLLSTVPQGVGGNVVAGGGMQSQNFGADGGYVKSITIMLDSADPGTVPDTSVTFTFNGTNTITASSSGFLNGMTYAGTVLTLDAAKGFVYGTLLFDFTSGDYTYFTGLAANQGDQFVLTSTVVDGDGDLATSVQTISIVDGKPVANDDTDTLQANATFLEGNVVTGVGTDAGIGIGDQFTAFAVSGDGVDRIVDNAVVTKVNYKGIDFILGTWSAGVYTATATASGSGVGYTYSITNGKLTWSSTAATGQQLIFDDSGYYKYTPPTSLIPDPSHTVTGGVITTSFTGAPAGITLVGVHTNGTTTTAEGALSYGGSGVGLNSATGDVDANRLDTNETLRVSFDSATRPAGVDNPSFVLNVNTVGNLVYRVYDTAGVQIGGPTTVTLTATGSQSLTLPSFLSVGRVDLQATTTSRFQVTSASYIDALQTVSLTSAASATAAGLTLSGLTSLNVASSVSYDANGAGVTGAASNQLGILESLVIDFNKATYGAGVQNVSFTATGVGSGFTYTAFGVDGQLLGRVSSNTNAVTIPAEYGYIGKIVVEAPSADNARIQSVRFQNVINSAAAAAVPEELVTYTLTDSTGDTDTAILTLNVLSNDYVGTSAGETLSGSSGNDAIAGLGGNDSINGGAGNDVIEGGDGNDTASGDAGNDIVAGGTGSDMLFGDSGNDVLRGNDGNDTLDGGANEDRLEGGSGSDTLLGGTGADTLLGGAGNDTLDGGAADGVSDVFKWELTDRGNPGAPAADTIINFSTAAAGSGGDVLDLRDLLQGENHQSGAGNLAQFLSFEFNGSDTIVHVSSTGGFGAGYNVSREDQTITLSGVNLVNGLANDQLVIQQLLTDQKLIVD